MDAYIYAADIYCDHCGEGIKRDLTAAGKAPADVSDESSYDSDQFPKGPYADGGGEADSPQHCGNCGVMLGNDVTPDGSAYIKAAWREFVDNGRGNLDVLSAWREGYNWEWNEFCEALESEIEAGDHTDLAERRFNDLAAH